MTVSFIFVLISLPFIYCGIFNFDELKESQYGIEILHTPISESTVSYQSSLVVTSIHGQAYQCSHPDTQEEEERNKQQEQEAIETGVIDLLKPLTDRPCLTHTKGWWTYELCYGVAIKQFHLEGGQVAGNTIQLGLYQSDYNWDIDDTGSTKPHQKVSRFHSQEYVNGSLCDLTNKPRSTQVRYFCEEGSEDYIKRIDEPETCVYVMSVHTSRLCHHPNFKPAVAKQPIAITCQPVLTESEYDEYTQLQQKEEEEKQARNKLIEEAKRIKLARDTDVEYRLLEGKLIRVHTDDEHRTSSALGNLDTLDALDDEEFTRVVAETLQDALSGVLAETMNNMFGNFDDDAQVEYNVHVFKDMEDIQKNLKKVVDMKSEAKKGTAQDDDGAENDDDEDEISEEDEELLNEFDQELDELKNRETISQYRDNIESVMNSKFSEILDEVETELGQEGLGDDIDKGAAMKQLGKTLNQLLNRLEKAEQELENADTMLAEQIEENEAKIKQLKKDLENGEFEEEEEDTVVHEVTEKEEHKEISSHKSDTEIITEKVKESAKLKLAKPIAEPPTSVQEEKDKKKSLRSRIRESLVGKAKEKQQKSEGKDLDQSKVTTIHASTVKTKINGEKGQDVEIKVITSGYIDKDGSLHLLSDDDQPGDVGRFIFSILGEGGAEKKETDRQQDLEEGYSFQFSKSKKHKQKQDSDVPTL